MFASCAENKVLTTYSCLQFINVLESNIYAKINALVNVTITQVTSGSAVVENTVAFTSSDSSAAAAGRSALFQTLSAGDTTIFGSSFGTVIVSNVQQGNATNPSESNPMIVCLFCAVILSFHMSLHDNPIASGKPVGLNCFCFCSCGKWRICSQPCHLDPGNSTGGYSCIFQHVKCLERLTPERYTVQIVQE